MRGEVDQGGRSDLGFSRLVGSAVLAATQAILLLVAIERPIRAEVPRIHGHVQYETFGYPDPDRLGASWENFFEAVARGRGRLTSSLTYGFETRLVADDVAFTAGGFSVRNEERRRPYFSLTSAVLAYRPVTGLRLSIGKQIVNWSKIDGLQPANLMTPSDESDIFRRVEQGVYSVSMHAERGTTYLDLTVVPLAFTPTRLPQGRWNIVTGDVARPQDLPPAKPNETQAGMRLGAQIRQLDLSLVGYVGRDSAAVFVPKLRFVGGEDRFDLDIIDRYPQLRAGGFTASYPLVEATLARAEMVYYSSPEEFRDNFILTVAGVEYTRGDWWMNLNYFRSDRTDKASEEVTDKGERQFFRSFILAEVRYDAGGRFQAHLSAGYDTNQEFLVAQSEVSYRVWGDLHVALVGELIDAYRPGYFDRVRNEDRLATRLTQYF